MKVLLACLALLLALPVPAKHFRWASQGDAASLDPHAQNENVTNQVNAMVYEPLLQYDKQMKLVPALATSFENPEPNRWVFHLRQGVKFHDGTPFTADDVVFSFERAKYTTASFKLYANEAGSARKLDDHTVEFTTPAPNPVEASMVANISIMSRAWCEKNRSLKPQDITAREETYAALHSNGTGPYILVGREPGVKTTHRQNPDWWGVKAGLFEGNADTVEYRPLSNAATRMAALRSGELDFVLDPPVQDIAALRQDSAIRVWEGQETRVIFVGFDQARDELLYSPVKGRNPFKDRRVRLALWQAIDTQALKSQVMRGLSVPTGIALPDPAGSGIPASMEKRPPYDLPAAKKLLAEAGYPAGFGFTITCPNNRYINDEKICTALAAMWARAGLDVKVEALPRAQFFPKALKLDVSAFIWGWGSDSPDAIFTLKPVLHSRDPAHGVGTNNVGDYRNAGLDELIDRAGTEMDVAKRQQMIDRAIAIVQDEVLVIPLHRQVIPWASRAGVQVVHRPNNALYLPWVHVP
ncbi:MAG TPA: ABC transporter substrate-binding protein [Usitatibacter sp.]|nr:ABC transporter substrate-binding protein [Usitatibacter sp.]